MVPLGQPHTQQPLMGRTLRSALSLLSAEVVLAARAQTVLLAALGAVVATQVRVVLRGLQAKVAPGLMEAAIEAAAAVGLARLVSMGVQVETAGTVFSPQ